MTGTDLLYPVAVLLLAYTIMGITGFGSALVAVPLLTWFWPLPEVVALMILLDVPASAIHGGLNFKMVQWRALRQMLPGMAAGTCVGWWLLGQLDKQWPLFFLGVYITLVGLRSLRKASGQEGGSSPMAFHGMSALVGVIEVMFATAGPVVIAVLQKKSLTYMRFAPPCRWGWFSLAASPSRCCLPPKALHGPTSARVGCGPFQWQRLVFGLATGWPGVFRCRHCAW